MPKPLRMMRQPTPDAEAYAWWHRALADPRTARHDAEPQPGFYTRRAVKNGPLLPVHVYLRQEIDPETGELMADEEIAAEELGWSLNPYRSWTFLRPVSREEFDALVERHRSDERMAATHTAYDVAETPTRPTKGMTYA